MSDDEYNKNVAETYLHHCSPDNAYEWLSEHLRPHHREIEEVLVERDHPLIDLGLARFGRHTLSVVYHRGDLGVRCAALGNPVTCKEYWRGEYHTWFKSKILFEILKNDDGAEFGAFFTNEFLHREFLIDILKRENPYNDIPDETFMKILKVLARNKRMSEPVPDDLYDGWRTYRYNEVYSSAWNLTLTLPADETNADVLAKLLQASCLPLDLVVDPPLLKRWSLTEPVDDKGEMLPSGDFDLRQRLADNLKPDETLLKHEDPACRASFYRRFRPWQFPQWPKFIETEKVMFCGEPMCWLDMMRNENLWQTEELRKTLKDVAWSIPDPKSDMMAPATLSDFRKSLLEEHPEWFSDEYADSGVANLEDKVDRIITSFGLDYEPDTEYSNLRRVPAKVSELEDNSTAVIKSVDRLEQSVESNHSSLQLKVTNIERKLEFLSEQLSRKNEVDNKKTWPVPHWFLISIIVIMALMFLSD